MPFLMARFPAFKGLQMSELKIMDLSLSRRGSGYLLLMALLLLSISGFGQGYKGELLGHITDPAGLAIAGVRVTAASATTGQAFNSVSDANGDFVISPLSPGHYSVTAERDGFKRSIVEDTLLEIDQRARVDIRLEVGDVAASVTVESRTTSLNTETPSLGTVITDREIVDIPLNGRSYLSLAPLTPGVVPAAAGANPYNINGSRPDEVNYLVDGVSNVNRRGNEPVITPSIDAIQEFKISTNSYSAEYGRLGSATISVALRRGGTGFHGTVFEFNRDDRFDARSFFDSKKLDLARNQFGGVLSGPVDGDRTFFLFSYEGLRNRQGQTVLTRVPTEGQRNGVFTSAIRNPYTGQPFADNTITPSLISPIAQSLLAFYPLPNRPGVLNYTTAADVVEDQDNFIVKIDHKFDDSNYLTGEYLSNGSSGENPFRATALPGYGSLRNIRHHLWSGAYTHIFSSSMVNEARVGYGRDRFREDSVNSGLSTSADVGITGVAPGYGLADLLVVGYSDLGDATFLPDHWHDNEFSLTDTFSLTTGRHLLKFGGELQLSRFTSLFAAYAGGQLAFNGAFSLNPFADLLLGLPVQTQRQVGTNTSRLSSTYSGLFVQDNWQIGQRLTLDLGLRYDLNTPPVERDDRWANFILEAGRQITAGTDGYPRALVRTRHSNFAPRIGFAYRPFADNKTVVRAGYGIFNSFDLQFTQYQLMGASAFPFTRLELFQATAVGNPSLANPFPDRPGLTPGALSPNGWSYENPTPYVQTWNVTLGHEVLPGLSVEASYVGSKGTHLSSTVNVNQTLRSPQGNIVPFTGLGRVLVQELGANSSYNALQLSVQRRFRTGLAFRSAFTWSKSIDNASFGSPARLPQNPNDLRSERGLSDFDRRRVWNSDFIYELPFGRGRSYGGGANHFIDTFLGGWQLSGIIQLMDGRPFTPVVASANAQAGFATRPDRLAPGTLTNPSIDRWFDRTAFAVVPANAFRFGNSGRDILIGPGAVNIDAAIFKQFPMPWEDQRLQIRAEIFNVPNHANFGQPDARIDQPSAGIISSAGPGRQIQLGAKYIF